MSDHVLVVTTTALATDRLDELIRRRVGRNAEVRVVAASSALSPLEWLVDDVDGAREQAQRQAESVAQGLSNPAEARAGDADPLQAIEDALRVFPADEIIVVTPREEDADWLEAGAGTTASDRFALPVTHLVAGETDAALPGHFTGEHEVESGDDAADSAPQQVAVEALRGRSERTPLLALSGVALVVVPAVCVVLLIAFLLYYFA